MSQRYCIICKARLTETNHSNYCGIHTIDSSIAIVLQPDEIAVKTSKIDAVIEEAKDVLIRMLEELKKKG